LETFLTALFGIFALDFFASFLVTLTFVVSFDVFFVFSVEAFFVPDFEALFTAFITETVKDKTEKLLIKAKKKSRRIIEDQDLSSVFGIELDSV